MGKKTQAVLNAQAFLPGEAVSSSHSCRVDAPRWQQKEHHWSPLIPSAEPWVRLWPWRPGDAAVTDNYAGEDDLEP